MMPSGRGRFVSTSEWNAKIPSEGDEIPTGRRSVLIAGIGVLLAGCLGDDDGVDHRGDVEIRVDGEAVDLSADRYQAEHADDYAMAFHLHEGSDQWYNEGDGSVTLADGLDKIPHFAFEVTGDGLVLSIDDETFDARQEGVTIETYVNGEPVDPETYELADGDEILVEVSSGTS